MARELREVNGIKLLETWAENRRAILDAQKNQKDIEETIEAYRNTENLVRKLTKAQQKVLSLRYHEKAGWEGIGALLGMRAEWAKKTADDAEHILRLLAKIPENTQQADADARERTD